MKVNLDLAKSLIIAGYVVVVDKKAKILHTLNKETGETTISYKECYLLEDSNKKTTQIKISKQIASKIVNDLKSVPDAFEWSSLQNNS